MKLQDQMRNRIKIQGKSIQTFKTYWSYCLDYFNFTKRDGQYVHPKDLNEKDVERWLTYLAQTKNVSKTTQNVALQSVCYLYREVLNRPLVGVSAIRATRPIRVRDVIDVSEITRLFKQLNGAPLLAAQLIYGCGLRIGDVVSLRIKDISFERKQLHIFGGKGDKDRYTSFPAVLHAAVKKQIQSVEVIHRFDLEQNPNGVSLPGAFRRKSPTAASKLMWYYLFPSEQLSRGEDGILCRHFRDKSCLGRSIREAAERAGILKRVTPHILRHCYATHANEQGVDMRALQQLLGHIDIRTTETYVHANKNKVTNSTSPIEVLASY